MRRVGLAIARAVALLAVIVGLMILLLPDQPRSATFYAGAFVGSLFLVGIAGSGKRGGGETTRVAELERALEAERAARVQAEAHARDLQHDLEKVKTARQRAERHAGKAGERIEDFERKLEEANKKLSELEKEK